jgi:hypothetical protein
MIRNCEGKVANVLENVLRLVQKPSFMSNAFLFAYSSKMLRPNAMNPSSSLPAVCLHSSDRPPFDDVSMRMLLEYLPAVVVPLLAGLQAVAQAAAMLLCSCVVCVVYVVCVPWLEIL